MIDVTWQALHDDAGAQEIYGQGSNVVESAANVLRLLGHDMPPVGEELAEPAK